MSLATLSAQGGGLTVTFEVSADRIRTWHDAKRSGPARWHSHEVHLAKPVKEFLGPGDDKITLSVNLDASRGLVVSDELANLRTIKDTGQVVTFVVGGELVADFILRDVSEEWRRTTARGVIELAVVELTLEEYT